jgi:hypothetical protein
MDEILKQLYESFRNILPDLSLRGRRAVAVTLIFVVATIMWFAESQTNFLYFWYLHNRVSILKDLNELAQAGITQNPELAPLYEEMVTELAERRYLSVRGTILVIVSNLSDALSSIAFWKFLSGGLWGFVFMLAGIVGWAGSGRDKRNVILGALVFGLFMGVIGIILPFHSPLVNFILFPVLQMVVLTLYGKRRQRLTPRIE